MPDNNDVIPIVYGMPETDRLRIVNDRATFAKAPDQTASLSGPVPQYGRKGNRTAQAPDHVEAAVQRTRPKLPPRKLTPDEMKALADKWIGDIKTEQARAMAAGPAVRHLEHGGPENGYETKLNHVSEKAFQAWRKSTRPWDTGEDYDLRGAFAAHTDSDSRGHLTDEYKKPNHPTFSNESRYAPYAPEKAGSWRGERYIPPRVIQEPEPVKVTPVARPTSSRSAVRVESDISGPAAKVAYAPASIGKRAGEAVRRRMSPEMQARVDRAAARIESLRGRADAGARSFMLDHPAVYGPIISSTIGAVDKDEQNHYSTRVKNAVGGVVRKFMPYRPDSGGMYGAPRDEGEL